MFASVIYDLIIYETIKGIVRHSFVKGVKGYVKKKVEDITKYLERRYYKKK
jgi:hypothetical protein